MSVIIHSTFGTIGGPSGGGAFDPLRWLTCPGNCSRLLAAARRRFVRGGFADGLPSRVRSARIEDAAQLALQVFTDADYSGISDDEPGRAVFRALRWCERAAWREPGASRMSGNPAKWSRGSDGARVKIRIVKRRVYGGSCAARGDDPARIVAAVESAPCRYDSAIRQEIDRAAARDALIGAGGEELTGETYAIEGGSGYPPTDGKMVRTPGGWKMERGRSHHPTEYPADTVADSVETDDDGPTFAGHAPIPAPRPLPPGMAYRTLPYDADREYAIAAANREQGTIPRAE